MKIIVDDKIPYIKGEIEQIADEVVYVPGAAFTPELVRDADALIVRTRTRCNKALLNGSNVRFIATATIGYDHIDTLYCEQNGICWSNCAGCNAGSVEQYIHAVLLLLKREKGMTLAAMTLGVVGVGHVGSKVAAIAERLGMRVLRCDPPRQDNGEEGFVPLTEVMDKADVVTLHVPLSREGLYATYHMIDARFFEQTKSGLVFINSSRGEVMDTKAVIDAIDQGKISTAIIDTWENEPHISTELLEKVYLGTPHIAGYSADGKANATTMALNAVCRFFSIDKTFKIEPPALTIQNMSDDEDLAFLQTYNPKEDSAKLKAHPEEFEALRGNYPLRRELLK